MTNKDKYLKDNVSVEEFIEALTYELSGWDNKTYSYGMEDTIRNALNKPIKPTLTEDERVILRNMPQKEWNYIFRDNMGNIQFEHLKANGAPNSIGRADWYNHLFQFIKERRRI